eukprot:5948950-Pleurochrysis_carterae.AAC.1
MRAWEVSSGQTGRMRNSRVGERVATTSRLETLRAKGGGMCNDGAWADARRSSSSARVAAARACDVVDG